MFFNHSIVKHGYFKTTTKKYLQVVFNFSLSREKYKLAPFREGKHSSDLRKFPFHLLICVSLALPNSGYLVCPPQQLVFTPMHQRAASPFHTQRGRAFRRARRTSSSSGRDCAPASSRCSHSPRQCGCWALLPPRNCAKQVPKGSQKSEEKNLCDIACCFSTLQGHHTTPYCSSA